MKQNQKVAKELAKQIAAMGYSMDGKKMSHGHALEVVSRVAGLPNWDTLSGMLESAAVTSVKSVGRGIRHLHIEGHKMGSSSDYSICPDVIAIIDMDAVWNAAAVLHTNKGLLESVRVDVNFRVGDDEDDFTPYGAWIDIYSTNQDGSPNFGMFCVQQKYTDDVHSRGLYFNQPNCGDWDPAYIDWIGGKEVAFIAYRNDATVEQCGFNDDRFATDADGDVTKIQSLPQSVLDGMGFTPEDILWYDFTIDERTAETEKLPCVKCGLPTQVDDYGLCNQCHDIEEGGASTKAFALQPIGFSGGVKSISDDDLCSQCRFCNYQPGGMSGCSKEWPGLECADGYVQKCSQFQRVTRNDDGDTKYRG